jgi:hypothetical protein
MRRNETSLLVTLNVALSSLILFTLMMEVICFSETLVPIEATRRRITEDGILPSHRRKNLNYFITLTDWDL